MKKEVCSHQWLYAGETKRVKDQEFDDEIQAKSKENLRTFDESSRGFFSLFKSSTVSIYPPELLMLAMEANTVYGKRYKCANCAMAKVVENTE